MDIKRKVIPMEIEGKEYDFVLDFASAIDFQDMYGKSIFLGLQEVSENQDVIALGCLIASCLKEKDQDESVGLSFIRKFDLLSSLQYFMEKIGQLMENSVPKESEDKKKLEKPEQI